MLSISKGYSLNFRIHGVLMKSFVGPRSVLAIFLTGSLALMGCSDDKDSSESANPVVSSNANVKGQTEVERKTLVDLVVESPDFSTLESLLIKADLVPTLQSGEFTVLAPTDAAFAKLPSEVVEALLANPEALRQVLLYHVVAGQAKAEAVLASQTLTAANGQALSVNLKDGKPYINDSAITATDILASNGVVHVIDTVLIPPGLTLEPRKALPNLVDLVVKGESFNTLEALLIKADLVDTVKTGEFTVFAPTDEAFAKLPKAVVDYLLSDKEALQQVLLYHVVGGTAKAAKVLKSSQLEAASGATLKVSLKDGKAFINSSQIIKTDVLASNGVVHVIDSVLVPPGFSIPAKR